MNVMRFKRRHLRNGLTITFGRQAARWRTCSRTCAMAKVCSRCWSCFPTNDWWVTVARPTYVLTLPFQPPTAARKRQNAFPHASKRRHCIELSATKECQAGQHPTRWHHRRESKTHFRINLDNNFTLPSEYALCCCRFANLWLKSLLFEMR